MAIKIRHILFLLFMVFTTTDVLAESVHLSVQGSRGRREIGVGDLFYIQYEVSNTNERPKAPETVPGAKIMYFEQTGQSSSMTSINGRMTQSYSATYTLTLRAQKEGSYTFGPVTVGNVKSNTVTYTIGGASPSQQLGVPQQNDQSLSDDRHDSSQGPKFIGKGDGNLFLKAHVSKTTAYEQEALVYTVKLYTTYDAIKFIGATESPKFEGFVVEESKDVSRSLEYETVNGKSYATAVIARYIIFPQMEGELKVKGNTYTVSVDEREYYHDPFWGSLSVAKPLQLNVTPNDLTVTVKSLPKPAPANFSGGVGDFKITSTLPSQTFRSNQAASIVYNVSGTGNLKYVTLPDLNALYPPQLEVYSPQTDVQAETGSTNVSGNVKFDYSFMPLESGTYTIPDVVLSYFDPVSGTYKTSTAKGYTISVEKGQGSAKSQTKGQLSFNKALLPVGKLVLSPRPWIYDWMYWLFFFIVPISALSFAVVYYRAYIKANADVMAVKSRKASKIARRRLRKAARLMNAGDTEHFYTEMLNALWGYLGDKLKMLTSDLSRQNVAETLVGANVPQETIDTVIVLIDDCEYAKYAPGDPQTNMRNVYALGEKAINAVEDSFNKKNIEKV